MRAAALPNAGVVINRRASLAITSLATHTIALPSAPVADSVLVCFFRQDRLSAELLTPPAGFTLAGMIQWSATAFSMGVWWRVTVPGDTGSLTFAGAAAANASAQLLELTGLAGAAPDYAEAQSDPLASVLTASSGTIAAASARGIALAAIATNGNAGTFGNTWDGGFRRLYAANGNTQRLALAYRYEVPAATALNTNESWSTLRTGLGIVTCFPQAA